MSAPSPLATVAAASDDKRAALANYRAAILAARAEGHTLAEIAAAAGIARQNVHKLLRRHERNET